MQFLFLNEVMFVSGHDREKATGTIAPSLPVKHFCLFQSEVQECPLQWEISTLMGFLILMQIMFVSVLTKRKRTVNVAPSLPLKDSLPFQITFQECLRQWKISTFGWSPFLIEIMVVSIHNIEKDDSHYAFSFLWKIIRFFKCKTQQWLWCFEYPFQVLLKMRGGLGACVVKNLSKILYYMGKL